MLLSPYKIAVRSIVHFWRSSAAVVATVAAVTAVLVGALVIGSSMRGSLRAMTLERLGRVDEILLSRSFFHENVIDQISQIDAFRQYYSQAEPIIFFPAATIERADTEREARASGISILGVRPTFWKLDNVVWRDLDLGDNEIAINRVVADELRLTEENVQRGNALVTLRIPKPSLLPGDSSLGKKRDLVDNIVRLKVVQILDNRGLCRFALEPSQVQSRNVFVSLNVLQEALSSSILKYKPDSDQINAVLLAGRSEHNPPDANASDSLRQGMNPAIEDWGLRVRRVTARQLHGATTPPAFDYYNLTTEQLVFSDELAAEIARLLPQAQPVFTYLVNETTRLTAGDDPTESTIPYSMFSAIDTTEEFQLESTESGEMLHELGDDEVILNEWAANDLGATVGDRIRLVFFQPESTHGKQIERSVDLTLTGIAKLTPPATPFRPGAIGDDSLPRFDSPPTMANDPNLTPEVPGLTDTDSIENWDLPFETTEKIRPADDEYWDFYRTTPKGFINLQTGRRTWSSRFGTTTSFRIPVSAVSETEIRQAMTKIWRNQPKLLGMSLVSVKREGLAASSGATPFDGLFLGLSMFVIVAALVLVSLVFRLGLEQRANQLGLFSAIGFGRRKIVLIWMTEVLNLGAIGALSGIVIGIAYAWLMIRALQTIWVGAITRPFLELHVEWPLAIFGAVVGLVVSALTIGTSIWGTRNVPERQLLTGDMSKPNSFRRSRGRWPLLFAAAVCVAAIGLSILAATLRGDAQAGSFMASGFMILSGLMLVTVFWLSSNLGRIRLQAANRFEMAILNARRNPRRSAMTIGLVAVATFLIVSISSFRLRPDERATGGIDWVAETSQPLYHDLNSVEGQRELLGQPLPPAGAAAIYSFRLKPGQDASCNNLYQATQPRVLGAPDAWIDRFELRPGPGMDWAGSIAQLESDSANPWRLLKSPSESGDRSPEIPCVIDKNTAMYSLKIFSLGSLFRVQYDSGEDITFRVVGFLNNSILQGCLVIGEGDFERLFPQVNGYRYFLIDANPADNGAVVEILERGLADEGFDARESMGILAQLMAVQNTYLTAFQSLGGLGLLLGTFGLATVQLRGIFERRRELALMQAVGFRMGDLVKILFWEQAFVLVTGMAIGLVAAAGTTIPHWFVGLAAVPWPWLGAMFALIGLVGLVTGYLAARAIIRLPLIASLRGE